MALISELTQKSTLDGNEQFPAWNSSPTTAYPDDNYRIKLSDVGAYLGAAIYSFAAVVSESSSDVIDGTSSSSGDVVYLSNAKVFAKRVTLTNGDNTSTKYYKQFTDNNCASGTPQLRKIYCIVSSGKFYYWNGTAFCDLFGDTRPTVLTEAEFEALGTITDDNIRYIIESE